MHPVDPVEALARALVAALLPALELAMVERLMLYREAVDHVAAAAYPLWLEQHGPEIARRAGAILDQIGPAAILTPYGREVFLRDTPVVEIQSRRPVNDNQAPPREAIGGRSASLWRRLRWWFSADP